MRSSWRSLTALLLFGLTSISLAQTTNPAADWQTLAPEAAGYSSARLEVVRAWLKTEPTSSMLVIAQGKVIFSYGDVAHVSKIASIRKSILSMFMGKYVISGVIDADKTVKQLGLEDTIPYTPLEERATLEQLMAGRSGVYRNNLSADLFSQEPPRGLTYPGTVFWYNNWEFNAAGVAFERLTHQDIYDALANDLAMPLGFQDFPRELQKKSPDENSKFPEFAMYLSARDMARLGLLMLNNGAWNGKPLIDPNWVGYSTSVITPWDEMEPAFLRQRGEPGRWGFGLAWWVWDAKRFPSGVSTAPYQGAFEARGTGGQYITVLPARGLVLVHRVDIDADPRANVTDWATITSMVVDAACPQGKCAPTK